MYICTSSTDRKSGSQTTNLPQADASFSDHRVENKSNRVSHVDACQADEEEIGNSCSGRQTKGLVEGEKEREIMTAAMRHTCIEDQGTNRRREKVKEKRGKDSG